MFFLRAAVTILPRLSLDVKEISAKVGSFGTGLPQKPMGSFGTCPTPEVGEMPCIQHRHLGAVIATHHCRPKGRAINSCD